MSDTIDTLAEWNAVTQLCGCCPMPSCPTPTVEYSSVRSRKNICGEENPGTEPPAATNSYSIVTYFYADGHSVTVTYTAETETNLPNTTYTTNPFTITTTESLNTDIPHVNEDGLYGNVDITCDGVRTEKTYTGTYSKTTTKTYSNAIDSPTYSYSGSSSYLAKTKITTVLEDEPDDVYEYTITASSTVNSDGAFVGTLTTSETNQETTTESSGGYIGGYTTKTVTTPVPIKPYRVYAGANTDGLGEDNPEEVVLRQLKPRFKVKLEPNNGTSKYKTIYNFTDLDYSLNPTCLLPVYSCTPGVNKTVSMIDPDYEYPEGYGEPDEDGTRTKTDSYTNPNAAPFEATSATETLTSNVSYSEELIVTINDKCEETTTRTGSFSGSFSNIVTASYATTPPGPDPDNPWNAPTTTTITSENSGTIVFVPNEDEVAYVPTFSLKVTDNTWKRTVEEKDFAGVAYEPVITYNDVSLTELKSLNPLKPAKDSYCIYDRGTYIEEITTNKVARYSLSRNKNYLDDGTTSAIFYSNGDYYYSLTKYYQRSLKPNAPEILENEPEFDYFETDSAVYSGAWDPVTGEFSGTSIINGVIGSLPAPIIPPECEYKLTGSIDLPVNTVVYSLQRGDTLGFADPAVTEAIPPTGNYVWSVSGSANYSGDESSYGPELMDSITHLLGGVGTIAKSNLMDNPDEDPLVEGDEYMDIPVEPTVYTEPIVTDMGFPPRVKWPNEVGYDPLKDIFQSSILYRSTESESKLIASPSYNSFDKVKVFYRWRIPGFPNPNSGHIGTAFKIMWDVVTVFDSARPNTVESDLSWVWTGAGVPAGTCLADQNDLSWYSPIFTLEPPEFIGYKKIVNIRYACYPSSPFGFKFQTTGETYP